jgi:hypothetical protein
LVAFVRPLHKVCGGWIDNLGRLSNFVKRNPAQFRMPFYHVFILSEVDAEGLVVRNITVLPLYRVADCLKCLIGCSGCSTNFCGGKPSDARNFAFDDISLQGTHVMSFRVTALVNIVPFSMSCITQFSLVQARLPLLVCLNFLQTKDKLYQCRLQHI